MHTGTPTWAQRNRPLQPLLLLLLLVSGGCQTVGDPACALQDELRRDHGRDALYAPDFALTEFEQARWYRCPPHWRPACPPLFRCPSPPRPIPTADEVLALPAPPSDAAE